MTHCRRLFLGASRKDSVASFIPVCFERGASLFLVFLCLHRCSYTLWPLAKLGVPQVQVGCASVLTGIFWLPFFLFNSDVHLPRHGRRATRGEQNYFRNEFSIVAECLGMVCALRGETYSAAIRTYARTTLVTRAIWSSSFHSWPRVISE